jgi:DNA polymerase I
MMEIEPWLQLNKVCLLDGDIICYKIASDKKQTEEQVEQQGLQSDRTWDQVKQEVDNYIHSLMARTQSSSYIIALTVYGCFRYDIYRDYKANRKDSVRPKFLDKIKEYLITEYKAIYHKGLEADDILSICARQIPNSFVASIDKDLLQIPGLHFNLTSNIFLQVDEREAKFNLFRQVLSGDGVDNIKGCPTIGRIKAKSFLEKTKDIPALFASLTLDMYIRKMGEDDGIEEFYKTYKLIKLLEKPEFGFVIPEPVPYELVIL